MHRSRFIRSFVRAWLALVDRLKRKQIKETSVRQEHCFECNWGPEHDRLYGDGKLYRKTRNYVCNEAAKNGLSGNYLRVLIKYS